MNDARKLTPQTASSGLDPEQGPPAAHQQLPQGLEEMAKPSVPWWIIAHLVSRNRWFMTTWRHMCHGTVITCGLT